MFSTYVKYEVKVACVLIALVQAWLGLICLWPLTSEPLQMVLAARGRDDDWGLLLVFLAGMVLLGSVCPQRKLRQLGLIGTAWVNFAIFGVMALTPMPGASLVTGILVMFGTASLYLVAADVIYGIRVRTEGRFHAQGS